MRTLRWGSRPNQLLNCLEAGKCPPLGRLWWLEHDEKRVAGYCDERRDATWCRVVQGQSAKPSTLAAIALSSFLSCDAVYLYRNA